MINFDELLGIISTVSGQPREKIISKERYRNYVIPRQLLCFYLREKYNYKLVSIGKQLGIDHTSVIHAIKKVHEMISINDPITLQYISLIDTELMNNSRINQATKIIVHIPGNIDAEIIGAIIRTQYKFHVEII